MPSTTRARRQPTLVLLAAVAGAFALVATTVSQPAQAAGAAAAGQQAQPTTAKHGKQWHAEDALDTAMKALSFDTPSGERPDATMALRDLALVKDDLSPADKAVADGLYDRPNLPAVIGDENILMHYDPAQMGYDVNTAFAQMQYVANTYAAAGYRRPKSDKGRGGDNRIDIYLSNLRPGYYGLCTTDQRVKGPKYDVWAYCIIDPDMAGFTNRTPIENFEVTAAHEYFHAVQFAYDIADDGWMMEATAAWAEDQLYDSINDNYQYLSRSPITWPTRSMDKFEDGRTFHYGVWSFFQFLTERYPTPVGPLPGLMLQIWQNADSSKGPRKDKYSVQAINKALRKNKTSLAEQFTLFSAATRYTHQSFSEGAETNWPTKPAKAVALAAGKKQSFKAKLDHLTSSTFNYANTGTSTQLKLKLRMAPKKAGSRAVVVTYGAGGAVIGLETVKINKRGKGKKKVAFGAGVVSVDVTLVNASTKIKQCYRYQNNPISCSGKAVYDNKKAKVIGKAT